MSQPAATQKICVKCGVNVSQRKRTKDQYGRYYCMPCWPVKTATPLEPPQPAEEPSESAELDVADAPPWDLPVVEAHFQPPPIVSTPVQQPRAEKPQASSPERTRIPGTRRILSMIGAAIAIGAGVVILVGIGFGIRALFRAWSTPMAKTTFTLSNPSALSATPFTTRI
jgi:hypothetical protein